MKKINLFLLTGVLILILSACHHHGYRTSTVRLSNDNESMKIEYCGNVVFNDDETAIEAISPEGYVKYRSNNKRFIVECDEDGDIEYKIYKGNRRLDYDDDEAREIINAAIRDIADHYNR